MTVPPVAAFYYLTAPRQATPRADPISREPALRARRCSVKDGSS
jgi:hypothetical protein